MPGLSGFSWRVVLDCFQVFPLDTRMNEGIAFGEVCQMLGRDPLFVRTLQRQLGLHIPEKDAGYSQGYVIFLEKLVSLRALHVPLEDIRELFEVEKKILSLLHVDALDRSPTWYLDECNGEREQAVFPERLLLSGHRLGFRIDANMIQPTLDFGERHPELFKGREMGEDVFLVVRKYVSMVRAMRERIERERPILENALYWARRVFK